MDSDALKPKVFISHSSTDTWVAKQIATHVQRCGAETFLDNADVNHGDDFEQRLLEAADRCTELVVLLTPWSTTRPYVWLEIGVFWGRRQRMVGLLLGLDTRSVSTDERIPIVLKRLDLVQLNDVDSYFTQLAARVTEWNRENARA